MQLVWLKRDLRLQDHEPLRRALSEATAESPVLLCYLHEPEFLRAADASAQQVGFVEETLDELDTHLARLGTQVLRLCADAVPALEALAAVRPVHGLWAHQETTHSPGFARDRKVLAWARRHSVPVNELPQNAVRRGAQRLQPWKFSAYLESAAISPMWDLLDIGKEHRGRFLSLADIRLLRQALCRRLPGAEDSPVTHLRQHEAAGRLDGMPEPVLGAKDDKPLRVRGGRSWALEQLRRFVEVDNLLQYPSSISSPLTAMERCSHWSAYLAWGVVSDREVFQAVTRAVTEAAAAGADANALTGVARFFTERLYWRTAYLQMMEDTPSLDQTGGLPIFNNLRESERMSGWLQAWASGRTGFPLIDAAMRMLNATGWLNMRLRGTVTSFALNDLWLPWREVGLVLAREFLDYEPAIHWNQLQIHAGVSKYSGPLTYDVVKQAREHDAQGLFVRQWVPELAEVPLEHLFEPWKMPARVQAASRCVLGADYPLPLVRYPAANDAARRRVAALREGLDDEGAAYWRERALRLKQQAQQALF